MSEEQGIATILIDGEQVARAEYWLEAPGRRREPQFGGLSVDDGNLAGRLFRETSPIVLRRDNKPDIVILIEGLRGLKSLSFRVTGPRG